MGLASGNSNLFLSDFNYLAHQRITIRDDQVSWDQAWDMARRAKSLRKSLVLIDTGVFSLAELEWLIEAKASVLSYPEGGRSPAEMLLLKKVAKRSKSLVVFGFRNVSGTNRSVQDWLNSMRQMGRGGIDLHVSGSDKPFEPEELYQLAADCRRGEAWFLYYHHGPVEPWLIRLAQERAWLHLAAEFYRSEDAGIVEELLRSYPSRQARLVFHCGEKCPLELEEIISAWGGSLAYLLPPAGLLMKKRRQLRMVEKSLPFRAYHLHPKAMF
ncbi:MAG: hypothetical protein ACUVWQ_07400 [Candidatus Aminicenantales bacterium]